MIIGIGTDICERNRIKATFEFAKRILSEKELRIYNIKSNQHGYLSNRFAAKEAISKAFGVGIGATLSFKDISVLNNDMGAPYVEISETALKKLPEFSNIYISISDEQEYAVAFVVVEK
jgi:holo-[acyl-carrier protein] synthase